MRTGAGVLGRRRVLDQHWNGSPDTREPRCTLRPRFAGPRDVRIAALLAYRAFLAAYRAFLAAYRDARERWLAGRPTLFPAGTYWLARFAAVPVASP